MVHRVCLVIPKNDWTNIAQEMEQMGRKYFVYDKATANNEVQTDAFKTVDESAQVDLKPEVAKKESQSEIMSKDGGVQTDGVAFQDTVMQTECVEKIDKSVEVNLRSEVAEKESQRKLKDENEKLKGELEGANQVLKAFIGLCDDQAQQIANLQTGNDLLEEENGELKSKLAELEKSYRELAEVVDKRGKEFLAKLKERFETIVRLE
ncbi:MAG: hypothetical protein LKM45_02140 [Wolbachia endosymbiont of Alcedoecus sp.]|nr:hypothetical protein [Wolbachia endosymbiont of Alcedoecus sp.]